MAAAIAALLSASVTVRRDPQFVTAAAVSVRNQAPRKYSFLTVLLQALAAAQA